MSDRAGLLPTPATIYAERFRHREALVETFSLQKDRLGWARLGVFVLGVILAGFSYGAELIHLLWLVLPILAFVFLLFRYDVTGRRLSRATRAMTFYRDALDRLEGNWIGRGQSGERFRSSDSLTVEKTSFCVRSGKETTSESSLYADDLDLFGVGSLFERICLARTGAGEERLAEWLKNLNFTREAIRQHQAAIQELTPRVGLREDLAILGAEVPPEDFAPLIAWGKAPPRLHSPRLRIIMGFLGAANVLLLLIGLLTTLSLLPFVFSMMISVIIAIRVGGRAKEVLEPVARKGEQLALLAGLLYRLERESFQSPYLRELRSTLDSAGSPPSARIAELARLIDWFNSQRNQMFMPFAVLLIWPVQMALAFEAWRVRFGSAIENWLDTTATFEALNSLAGYAFENPDHTYPEIADGSPRFSARDLGHPLLPLDQCVLNDVDLGEPVRLLVVSGSNMSGKSTLLRSVGVNTVLALIGAPVRASSLTLTPVQLGATLRIQDSLLEGRSRFFAEVTRLRGIMEAAQKSPPMLFLLDELFHGTNSHDRGIGAEALLRHLLDAGAIGLVTTHDLSLTTTADQFGALARKVHFVEEMEGDELTFDYKMRPGVVPHGNGLAIMRAVGLDIP